MMFTPRGREDVGNNTPFHLKLLSGTIGCEKGVETES